MYLRTVTWSKSCLTGTVHHHGVVEQYIGKGRGGNWGDSGSPFKSIP